MFKFISPCIFSLVMCQTVMADSPTAQQILKSLHADVVRIFDIEAANYREASVLKLEMRFLSDEELWSRQDVFESQRSSYDGHYSPALHRVRESISRQGALPPLYDEYTQLTQAQLEGIDRAAQQAYNGVYCLGEDLEFIPVTTLPRRNDRPKCTHFVLKQNLQYEISSLRSDEVLNVRDSLDELANSRSGSKILSHLLESSDFFANLLLVGSIDAGYLSADRLLGLSLPKLSVNELEAAKLTLRMLVNMGRQEVENDILLARHQLKWQSTPAYYKRLTHVQLAELALSAQAETSSNCDSRLK